MAPYVREFRAAAHRDDEVAAELMLLHGVPPDVVTVLRSVTSVIRRYGCSFEVDLELARGSELELAGRRLRVLHRPGHSPSDTVFEDEAHGVLLVGDHLLADVSSNALIAQPLPHRGGAGEIARRRPRALRAYMRSLRATGESRAAVALTGHGPPVHDHRALIRERLARHDQRAAQILERLRERPATAYEIAGALWGGMALTQAFLTISEVLGHADLLIERGEVVEEIEDDVARFRAA
jgi:glyoxylase-like metal-dependent hydrolase (beta-lactamase superfamily II)